MKPCVPIRATTASAKRGRREELQRGIWPTARVRHVGSELWSRHERRGRGCDAGEVSRNCLRNVSPHRPGRPAAAGRRWRWRQSSAARRSAGRRGSGASGARRLRRCACSCLLTASRCRACCVCVLTGSRRLSSFSSPSVPVWPSLYRSLSRESLLA